MGEAPKDWGNMGTSESPMPKPFCVVKNKALSFARPGNIKKKKNPNPNEKWKTHPATVLRSV